MQTATASARRINHGPARTFRAADVRGALAAVKAALGSEAVILGTRELNGGLFRTAEIEITAAVEQPDRTRAEPASERAHTALLENDLGEKLLDGFLDRGFSRSLARVLVRRVIAGGARDVASADVAARALIATKVTTTPPPWMPDRRRIIALVGPTGVGKTTTIAKLAARAIVESRLKVALVTVDTYRIGASDQLARYGDIMRVPTFVAQDATKLSAALHQCARADLVLVDTAGRTSEPELVKQAKLLGAVPGIDLFLTLSLTSSARDMEATVDRFRFMNPERVILTKIDEAVGPGCLLSAATRLSRPVTCITNGQRVPEDIHAVNAAQLVDLAMGAGFDADAPATSHEKGY